MWNMLPSCLLWFRDSFKIKARLWKQQRGFVQSLQQVKTYPQLVTVTSVFLILFFLVFVFLCVLCISASSHTHGTDCVVRCCLTCPCFIYLQLHFYKLRACVAKDLLFLIRTHLLVFCLDRIFFCYSLWWRLIVKPAS